MKFIAIGIISVLFSSVNALKLKAEHFANVANCNQLDDKGNCTKCNFRWVLKDGQCVAVSDQCKTWDDKTADCTSCYDGWQLSNGKCILPNSGSGNSGNQVANCNQYDDKGKCTKCNFRWVLKDDKCVAVDDQCKTWDDKTADCTSCYDGWQLSEGKCIKSNSGGSSGGSGNTSVANCSQYDSKGACTQCYFRYVVKDGKCVAVSDQCKTWDNKTGDCTSCYDGWKL